jgi:glycopeptide antibiotics resistance protein
MIGSLAIEITQASGLPQRVGTPRDVIANSLGALIGYLLACVVIRAVDRTARRRSAYRWLASIQAQSPAAIRRAPDDN